MSYSSSAAPTWQDVIQAATRANEQMDHQGRKCKQAHDCLGKLLVASQMRTALLRADQEMLRNMRDRVTSASRLPPDMHPPWHRRSASHSFEVADDEIEVVIQELKDVLSSLIAANGCHATWRQLGPVLAKIPAPEPEIISGPRPEKMPWSHLQNSGEDSMAASVPLRQQAALIARLLPAPEFKLDARTAVLPKAGSALDIFRSTAKVRYSDPSRSSHEQLSQGAGTRTL